MPFGYNALVRARRMVAECSSIAVVATGPDSLGGRLLVELFRSQGGALNSTVPTRVERIEAGLSYPMDTRANA